MGAVTFEGPLLNSNLCCTKHIESFGMDHSIILPPYPPLLYSPVGSEGRGG